MKRWFGNVGYIETVETDPGIWEEQITVKPYYGELIRNSGKFQVSGEVNDDRDVAIQLSIVADAYAENHFSSMRYVEMWGEKWKITSVEPNRPRLILQIGGVYNG